jgi:O-Antigen ligase
MSNQDIAYNRSADVPAPVISIYEYLYIFVLIIYAGRANAFVEASSIKDNPAGVMFPIILSGILAIRWRIRFDARFFSLLFGFALYFLAISIKFKVIQPTFIINYFSLFFIVYVAIKALRFNLFLIYERLLYYLAIIGLFFWVLQIGLRGDNLFYLISRIPGIDLFSYVSGGGLNAVLYSVQPTFTSLLYNFSIPRNCGYAWEPGAFAVYLCLAVLINLFFIKNDAGRNKRLWVLLIALLSTQSTTGYLIFVVIVLYYLLNKRLNIIILLLPFAVIALAYVSSLPFMSKKVIELIDETKQVDQLLEDTYGRETSSTPQRFTSFILTFKDFRNNPILGVGGHKEATYLYKVGSNISPISGIGNLLAQFGLVGFIFFTFWTIKSSFFFARHYGYSGRWLLALVVLFISVSYSMLLLALVMCFWAFELFADPDKNRKEESEAAVASGNGVVDP